MMVYQTVEVSLVWHVTSVTLGSSSHEHSSQTIDTRLSMVLCALSYLVSDICAYIFIGVRTYFQINSCPK